MKTGGSKGVCSSEIGATARSIRAHGSSPSLSFQLAAHRLDQCGGPSNFETELRSLTHACCERTNICRRGTSSFRWRSDPAARTRGSLLPEMRTKPHTRWPGSICRAKATAGSFGCAPGGLGTEARRRSCFTPPEAASGRNRRPSMSETS